MRKNFLKLIGALAIILALALNLQHASNDYGLRTGTFWTNVKAQETTGTSWNGPWFCVLQLCSMQKGAADYAYCMWHCGECMSHNFMNCWPGYGDTCAGWCEWKGSMFGWFDVIVGGTPDFCSYGHPPGNGVQTVGIDDCIQCFYQGCYDYGLVIQTTN